MKTSIETVKKILSSFVAIYPECVSFETLSSLGATWFIALQDLDDADVKAACHLVIHQLSRFPTPADLRDAVHTIQSVRAIEARHAKKAAEQA